MANTIYVRRWQDAVRDHFQYQIVRVAKEAQFSQGEPGVYARSEPDFLLAKDSYLTETQIQKLRDTQWKVVEIF